MADGCLKEVLSVLSCAASNNNNLTPVNSLYNKLLDEFCSKEFLQNIDSDLLLSKHNRCRCFDAEWCIPKKVPRAGYVPIR